MTTVCGYLCAAGRGDPLVTALTGAAGGRLAAASDGLQDGDVIVWGIIRGCDQLMHEARARHRDFFHMDHPYFGRGGEVVRYRLTRNGLQDAGLPQPRPADRWDGLGIRLQPWRRGGREILVCPPGPAVQAYYGNEAGDWLARTLEALARHTDRPIVVRQKPPGLHAADLPDALRTAHAVVTYVSNVAVDAVVEGVPVFVDEKSAARHVGLTDLGRIESPARPDRERWCRHLAYGQFTVEELGNGIAWSVVREAEGAAAPQEATA